MVEESQQFEVAKSTYDRLRILKAEFSANAEQALSWDEFYNRLADIEDRKQALASWLYTIGVFLLVSLLFFLPALSNLGAGALGIIIAYLVFAVSIAAFTTYIMAPWTLRKLNSLTTAPTGVHESLSRLTERAQLEEEPQLRLMETPEINAMTYSGPKQHYICLTQGLLDAYKDGQISQQELEAFIAHEIGHIKRLDVLKSNLALSWASILRFGGAIYYWMGRISGRMADFLPLPGPFGRPFLYFLEMGFSIGAYFAQLIAKAASIPAYHLMRQQEYGADRFAAQLVGPQYMAAALAELERLNKELEKEELDSLPYADRWQQQPANPSWVDKLFDTHPPTERRSNVLYTVGAYLDGEATEEAEHYGKENL